MDDHFYRTTRKKSRIRGLLKKGLRNKRVVLGVILGIPVLLLVLFGDRGILQRVRLERQKAELLETVRRAEEETGRLQAESKALEKDPKAIEKVAREKYGMARRGEKIYKVRKEE